MKKYLIMPVLLLALSLSGCNSNKTLSVSGSIDGFYQAYYDGNIDEMYKYIADTMKTPTMDSLKENDICSNLLDLTNDFVYKIDSIVGSDDIAYVNIKYETYDGLQLIALDIVNGFDYLQYDLDDPKSLVASFEHYKATMENTKDYQEKATLQIKMIKKNNKWYFDDKEKYVMAPYCMFFDGGCK